MDEFVCKSEFLHLLSCKDECSHELLFDLHRTDLTTEGFLRFCHLFVTVIDLNSCKVLP